jgi:alpha-glucoside transport system substrate-binding protein
VDGTLYAAALDASVKSLVWYSPKAFAAKGYAVPTTWDEMLALSTRIVADGGTPWCAGAEAGAITGWPIADFLEDAVLREGGPELFDGWVEHTIPADAPPVAAALDKVGAILKNPTFVNGGIGDIGSITTTPVRDGGLPVLLGGCFLHRQADTYASSWPDGTDVSAGGDVFAFPLPPLDPDAEPTALVGGGFVAAFSDRREVQALQAYLATPEWANARARDPAGGLVVPSSGLDAANLSDPVDRLAVGVLQDPRVALRFDGSDRMPAAVGSGTLPRALADWLNGTSTKDALATVEATWPR